MIARDDPFMSFGSSPTQVPARTDAPGPETAPRRYRVFISYSHADTPWAGWLMKKLEGYRVPARFHGRPAPVGVVGPRLAPVFRDRDELPTTSDLGEVIKNALRDSATLVVICSPNSAKSRWVLEEIKAFKRLHGERHVFAFIVAGEPKHEGAADDCFSPALRRALGPDGELDGPAAEVVAADAREHADGKGTAFVRLVAGLLGAGFDELRQRELQRRHRRLTLITAASVAGMVLTFGLAVAAWRARGEALVARNDAVVARDDAKRGRDQAEDLVEFMLGDLRRKLDAVGRLDVLDSVGEKAVDYYARQPTERMDAPSLGRRSRALHLIGEMREQGGRLAEALDVFQRGAATTALLLAQAPADPQRIFDHAQSVFWVGFIAWRRGQIAAAEQAFREYLDLAQQLVRHDARNPDWQAEACYARNNIGVVFLTTGRAPEALALFTESRDTWLRIVTEKPARAFDLANTVGWLAKAHETLGAYEQAIAEQHEKRRALHLLPDAATNRRVQRQEQTIVFELARLDLALGRLPTALALAGAAVETAQVLVTADAQNKFWLEQLVVSQGLLTEIQMAIGDLTAARETSRTTLAGCAKLAELDSTVANWHVGLQGRALINAVRLATGSERQALIERLSAFLLKAQKFSSGALDASTPNETTVAEVELRLGNLLAGDGRADEAVTHWRACAARLAPIVERTSQLATALLAQARLRLGEIEPARALARRIAATPFRHPAYAELTHLLADGAGPAGAQLKK
ncbi:MAG: TIR domain-containing protein [Verrucomicrobia bacterium]|nr:TIR domain-containing protein [Verrucomicrobiota bacterium]